MNSFLVGVIVGACLQCVLWLAWERFGGKKTLLVFVTMLILLVEAPLLWGQAKVLPDGSATVTVRLSPQAVKNATERLKIVNTRRGTNQLALPDFLQQLASAQFVQFTRTNAPSPAAARTNAPPRKPK
ncbi:MAG: hypothetical protein V4641_22595 [Pseudomonadota bacterium]